MGFRYTGESGSYGDESVDERRRKADELLMSIRRLKKHNKQLQEDIYIERRRNQRLDATPADLMRQKARLEKVISTLRKDIDQIVLQKQRTKKAIDGLESLITELQEQVGAASASVQRREERMLSRKDELTAKIVSVGKKANSLEREVEGLRDSITCYHETAYKRDKSYYRLLKERDLLKKKCEAASFKVKEADRVHLATRHELRELMMTFAEEKEKWAREMADVRAAAQTEGQSDEAALMGHSDGASNSKKQKMSQLLKILTFASTQPATRDSISVDSFVREIMSSSDLNSGVTNYINSLTKHIQELEIEIASVKRELQQYRSTATSADSITGMKQAQLLEDRCTAAEKQSDLMRVMHRRNDRLMNMISACAETFAVKLGLGLDQIQLIYRNGPGIVSFGKSGVASLSKPQEGARRRRKKENIKMDDNIHDLLSVVQAMLSQRSMRDRDHSMFSRLKPQLPSLARSSKRKSRVPKRTDMVLDHVDREELEQSSLSTVERRLFEMPTPDSRNPKLTERRLGAISCTTTDATVTKPTDGREDSAAALLMLQRTLS